MSKYLINDFKWFEMEIRICKKNTLKKSNFFDYNHWTINLSMIITIFVFNISITPVFWLEKKPLWINKAWTQIENVILYSKQVWKISVQQKIIWFGIINLTNMHLNLRISYTHITNI